MVQECSLSQDPIDMHYEVGEEKERDPNLSSELERERSKGTDLKDSPRS